MTVLTRAFRTAQTHPGDKHHAMNIVKARVFAKVFYFNSWVHVGIFATLIHHYIWASASRQRLPNLLSDLLCSEVVHNTLLPMPKLIPYLTRAPH